MSNNLFKLNGWQRLWILLSAIYGLALAAYVGNSWPKEVREAIKGHEMIWALDTVALVVKCEPALREYFPGEVRYGLYKNMGDVQVVRTLQRKYKDEIDFSEVNDKYQNNLDEISPEKFRKEAYQAEFLIWLFSVVSVYLLGWAVSWVIRGGFYRNKT